MGVTIPVYRLVREEVVGLPEPNREDILIVPRAVMDAVAATGRTDLYTWGKLSRNAVGELVCEGLEQ